MGPISVSNTSTNTTTNTATTTATTNNTNLITNQLNTNMNINTNIINSNINNNNINNNNNTTVTNTMNGLFWLPDDKSNNSNSTMNRGVFKPITYPLHLLAELWYRKSKRHAVLQLDLPDINIMMNSLAFQTLYLVIDGLIQCVDDCMKATKKYEYHYEDVVLESIDDLIDGYYDMKELEWSLKYYVDLNNNLKLTHILQQQQQQQQGIDSNIQKLMDYYEHQITKYQAKYLYYKNKLRMLMLKEEMLKHDDLPSIYFLAQLNTIKLSLNDELTDCAMLTFQVLDTGFIAEYNHDKRINVEVKVKDFSCVSDTEYNIYIIIIII